MHYPAPSFSPRAFNTIIYHLEPNIRIALSNLSPIMNIIDRRVHMSVFHLCFDNNVTIVNDTKYTVGVVRHYPPTGVPLASHIRENKEGGARYEIGIVGRHHHFKGVVYDGDLKIGPRGQPEENESDRILMENELRRMKIHDLTSEPSEERSTMISKLESQLFLLKHAEMLPYTKYIQFTIESPRGKLVWYRKYGPPYFLFDAIREVRSALFNTGKGTRYISVSKLEIGPNQPVLRLPRGPIFQIRILQLHQPLNSIFEDLAPIINKHSFPLKGLVTQVGTPMQAREPKLLAVKHLVITNEQYKSPKFNFLWGIQHNDVVFKFDGFNSDIIFSFLKCWNRVPKAAGREFYFQMPNVQKLDRIISALGEVYNMIQISKNRKYLMSLGNTLVNVSAIQRTGLLCLLFKIVF